MPSIPKDVRRCLEGGIGNLTLYLYAVLETETRIALLRVGLDPGMGLLHADQPARDSLACDVMEAVRPAVDGWLLDFVRSHTFTARDVLEVREGAVRVTARLTPTLAETAPLWAKAVAPVAERVAEVLYRWWKGRGRRHGATAAASLPTPLTQANRSADRATNSGGAREKAPKTAVARRCRECGKPLAPGRAVLCGDPCRDAYARDVTAPKFHMAGPAKLAQLRTEGGDPTKTPAALMKVGRTQRERAAARMVWETKHAGERYNPETFRSEVLPLLQGVPLSVLVRATGLSLRYCSQIRRGIRVPHAMYWDALACAQA